MEQSNHPSNSKCCYPGGDANASSAVFLSLYEEEEALEQPEQGAECKAVWGASGGPPRTNLAKVEANRPTVYYVLRLFDSIIGFHKGYLDLSGRHPESYYELQIQWNGLLGAFLGLENQGVITRPSQDGRLIRKPYNTLDPGRWQRFQFKYRLPETLAYTQLLANIQRVLRELEQHPIPKFQRIRIVDLPIEVLDNVISVASIAQSKALSCTCHKLNDIGQRHIFRTWRMHLHIPPHIAMNVQYSHIDLPTLARNSCHDLGKNAEFIRSTPHIASRIQKLVLVDEWVANRRSYPDHNNPFSLCEAFYKSVTHSFASVFRTATQLSTLALCNLEITLDICRMIANTHTLHTLELHLCSMGPSLARSTAPTCAFRQIVNLHIYMDSSFPETYSQWYSLLFCPKIRTLSIIQCGIGPATVLETRFWDRLRLEHLERLALDNIYHCDLEDLTAFLDQTHNAVTHLTHFKLHMDWGFPDADVQTLLLALREAPLEVLVLEGLAEAEFPVFHQIAAQYSELVGLTLVRRQNPNQHENKLAIWPHASWEYAPCLKAFRALRHFCWNFRTEYWDATPSTLVAFENDFDNASSGMTTKSPRDQLHFHLTDEVPYFLDSHWMALPFAAHCPTLESFCIMDSTVDMVCRIARQQHTKAIVLAPKYSAVAWNVQRWNTVSSRWPPLMHLPSPKSD